jgi:hypothetical protein
MWYIYTLEYYSILQKEILSFATTWMNTEDIILKREKSQASKDMISLSS